jgi:uncharacterized membrane protein
VDEAGKGSNRVAWTLAAIALLAIGAQSVYVFPQLPDHIPTHFDAAGHVNGWGGKASIFFLPGVAAVALALLFATRTLSDLNLPFAVRPENRARVIALGAEMRAWLAAILMLGFLGIQSTILEGAFAASLPAAFSVVTVGMLAGVFGCIGVYFFRMYRVR